MPNLKLLLYRLNSGNNQKQQQKDNDAEMR